MVHLQVAASLAPGDSSRRRIHSFFAPLIQYVDVGDTLQQELQDCGANVLSFLPFGGSQDCFANDIVSCG